MEAKHCSSPSDMHVIPQSTLVSGNYRHHNLNHSTFCHATTVAHDSAWTRQEKLCYIYHLPHIEVLPFDGLLIPPKFLSKSQYLPCNWAKWLRELCYPLENEEPLPVGLQNPVVSKYFLSLSPSMMILEMNLEISTHSYFLPQPFSCYEWPWHSLWSTIAPPKVGERRWWTEGVGKESK